MSESSQIFKEISDILHLHILLDHLVQDQPGDGRVVRLQKLERDRKVHLQKEEQMGRVRALQYRTSTSPPNSKVFKTDTDATRSNKFFFRGFLIVPLG
jgi:hypothetical protein